MISEVIFLEYLSCLLEGDKPKCSAIVAHLIENKVDPKELYERLFQRSLERVGKLWENNKICGATEHMATTITECLMSYTYPVVSAPEKIGKKVIVACVPKEFHQVGAKMVADVFELQGWEAYCLGANTKETELFKLINEKQPDLLALSMSLYLNVVRLTDMIESVKKEFPQLEIIVGGQAFKENSPDFLEQYYNVKYIPNLKELEKFIKERSKAEKKSIA
ncbi:MAG: B12-binding domain-containing protein [Bacteroidota bacterium]|jgi:methanogenic corrinoid protein MtbC1|nr:cobalamin-binding protein [Ignavibacteria bacterium]HEX2963015.1 cobalamin-dependent protein [Ignavibacteriales bacterium]MCU7499982.1 cobalamin-binding protein [Ignavibacteria bacterium]MCU7514391.1 cobalamin-binding protein [Ignavibacteria bacterium]MCU7519757.1 cobalamin-binding protein [Ignavibacteria bacterium]